jgi:hypothetical protein
VNDRSTFYTAILISVTEICTVGCRHCGFTGAIRERQPAPEEISTWTTDACDFGIPRMIFTGGEPFQRFSLLKAGVRAAAAHPNKPSIGCFTSSFWGKTPATVDKILGQLDGMDHFYLSTDIFHQEQVPAQYVINVIEGAMRYGVENISLCITIGDDSEEAKIRKQYTRFEDRVMINVDRVISSPHISTARPSGHRPEPAHFASSCFLHTPIINPNGDLCACHVAKIGAHRPLNDDVYYLGNLKQHTFAEIMKAADEDYAYQFLRVYGPQGVARMVNDTDHLTRTFGDREFSNGCDLCSKVLMTKHGREALRARVEDPFERDLIDGVRSVKFGERR